MVHLTRGGGSVDGGGQRSIAAARECVNGSAARAGARASERGTHRWNVKSVGSYRCTTGQQITWSTVSTIADKSIPRK